MRCTLPIRQDKAKTKLGKRNRKIQKKKNASKKRKKCHKFEKETRAENNRLNGKFENCKK